jgi:hypothetical protein
MANPNNANNVSFGKPKASGAVFRAPLGTVLPQDATSPLDPAFENIGYISEDGITRTTDSDSATINDMSGATVLNVITTVTESVQFVAIETNKETLSMRYGDANVVENPTAPGELQVTHNGIPSEAYSYVIELLLTGNRADRLVIPNGTISELGDMTYDGADPIGFDMTLSCNASAAIDGGTIREYVAVGADAAGDAGDAE